MRLSYGTMAFSVLALGAQLGVAHAQTNYPNTPDIRPGNDIGTRESLPLSPNASNIGPGDTGSTIAPTPPLPDAPPGASAGQLLFSARSALASNQTGKAQEALERAETRLLDRTVYATQTNYTSQDPLVAGVDQALQLLGSGNTAGAAQVVNQILASNAPELAY